MVSTLNGSIYRTYNYEKVTTSSGLSLLPKLKREHIQLTYSKMRVDLAAQVNIL